MKRPHTTVVVLLILAVVLGSAYAALRTQFTPHSTGQSAATFMPLSANSPGPVEAQMPSSAYTAR